MLARTPRFVCVECAKTEHSPSFQWYHDDPAEGPAYWSDKGVLCSSTCAAAHARARGNSLPTTPVDEPF